LAEDAQRGSLKWRLKCIGCAFHSHGLADSLLTEIPPTKKPATTNSFIPFVFIVEMTLSVI